MRQEEVGTTWQRECHIHYSEDLRNTPKAVELSPEIVAVFGSEIDVAGLMATSRILCSNSGTPSRAMDVLW